MLDVFVLGAVKASTDKKVHALGGATQRALLARLVVARGRPIPPEHLIDELWEDSPPRDPAHALQARISRLRSAVPVAIELLDGGYVADPSGIQTDAARFEQLREQGGLLVTDGDLAQAAECFYNALDLWRGDAFAGLPDIPTLRVEAVRLEELRAAALANRIDLDLALGRSGAILPELHALVGEFPLYERHWGQLMTALYWEGRAQEALAVFAHARSGFADGLGVEPSHDLGRLHMAILREQPPESLLRLPVAVPLVSVDGPTDDKTRNTPTRALTSHQPELLVDLLRGQRTIILTGPAGIGKTHLLRAVGTRFEAQNCTAPIVMASSLSQPVPLGVFAGIGESLPQAWASPAALIDHFTRHRSATVLLVDNVDQLDEASLFVVTQLIRTTRLPAILTTRDLTGAPEEVRALYDSGEIVEVTVEALTPADAEAIASCMVEGLLTPDAAARIYEAAGGNPLYLREVVTASLDEGRLVLDGETWELRGPPASTPRLTQLVGQRFHGLDDASVEVAAKVAIAGELPATALGATEVRALARAGVVEYSATGWLRLAHPLDGEVVRAQCSAVLWHDLTVEVLQLLLSEVTADWPAARRRAHILALDLGGPLDVPATLAVARHALGTLDDRLALRAAEAVAAQGPGDVEAYRIAGLAASSLGRSEAAAAHLDSASDLATTAAELTAVALARARHLGVFHHDAAGAFAVLQHALEAVTDPEEAGHLQRDSARWAAIAGRGSEHVTTPDVSADAAVALGLITIAMSGVIIGPLADTEATLARLRRIPAETVQLVPGGADLIELTEVMALSNTGDVVATRRRLERVIADARTRGSESLGSWEYALGFSELLSGDTERAHHLGSAAVGHLEWRDISGLLPAARALSGAAARATGRDDIAESAFGAIPDTAVHDPKVVMLQAWADAWRESAGARTASARTAGARTAGARTAGASRILLDTAQWLMHAQHHYFAGMLAHCAIRVGEDLEGAMTILKAAKLAAGGGLLELLARHGAAMIADDRVALEAIAREAQELGMVTTAADTWLYLASTEHGASTGDLEVQRHGISADRLRTDVPSMVLWTPLL